MAHLVVESGADKRKIFALTGSNKFICGRSSKASIIINDPFASGQHFGLLYKDDTWFLQDLKSSNGVELNEEKVTSGKLADGDIIHVGSTYLRFVDQVDDGGDDDRGRLPKVAGYDVIDRLGVGGMGEVYRAKQVSLDREVALKILFKQHTKDKEFVRKFFQEARSAGNLNHPNIVQVHDVGQDNGVCFICMEYISGGNLTDLLRKYGSLDQATTIRVSIEVSRGLAYAKSKNLVHCDIKPDNIMFSEAGMAKIADLGIARHISEEQTQQKEVLGSPHYMAPEQAMGRPVDHRADLYSLGCTMFRMLAGRTPFSGTSAHEVMKKQVTEEPPDIMKLAPNLSPELADVIDCLLEKKPENRIQSANELIALLEKINNAPAASPARATVNKKRATVRAPVATRTIATTRVGAAVASGGARRRKSDNTVTTITTLILLVVIIIAGWFIYKVGIDYKPKNAYNQAAHLYRAERYEEALEVLSKTPNAVDEELAENIRLLKKDVLLKVEETKAVEAKEYARQHTEELFVSEWNKYLRERQRKRKRYPDILKILTQMETTFAADAGKLTKIRAARAEVEEEAAAAKNAPKGGKAAGE